jgi:hypothetical protein
MIVETDHDFGVLDVRRKCEHRFVIRNVGQAPLELRRGPTTCKCTLSDLPAGPIPPGGQAEIRVGSKIDHLTGPFVHAAKVFTNDPDKKTIRLQIRGSIRKYLEVDPPGIVFSGLQRDKSSSREVIVFSQVWSCFSIVEVKSSLNGLTWQLEAVEAERLAELDARSGYRLAVTLPSNLPGGRFREWIQFSVHPTDPDGPRRSLKLDVIGEVPTRFSLYGKRVVQGKVVRLGAVPAGKGARERLTMKVRDEHQELTVRGVRSIPEFLRVRVAPLKPDSAELGLYRIDIEVPRGAPTCNYMGPRKGEIQIETDHPMLPLLTLRVDFSVI